MKRILFLALILIASCAPNEEKVATLEKRVVLIETKLDSYQKLNGDLKKQNIKLLNRMDSVSKTVDELYLPKEYLSLVVAPAFHYVLDKKKVIKTFFEDFNLKEYDVERGIANSYYLSSYEEQDETIDSKYDLFQYIFKSIDRSPEGLQSLFTDEVKQIIYALFESNDLYEDTGSEAMVEALLLAYEELVDDYETLSQIYNLAAEDYSYDEIHEIISYTATDEIREILSDENYTTYDNDTWSEVDSRLFIVYTFWARRDHEGNQAVVYSLLKEFHRNVTKKELTDEITDDSDERKLRFLSYGEAGLVGFFNDGTITKCEKCDLLEDNIKSMYDTEPESTYEIKDNVLVTADKEYIPIFSMKRETWAIIDYENTLE